MLSCPDLLVVKIGVDMLRNRRGLCVMIGSLVVGKVVEAGGSNVRFKKPKRSTQTLFRPADEGYVFKLTYVIVILLAKELFHDRSTIP